jgi:hypothetical protein
VQHRLSLTFLCMVLTGLLSSSDLWNHLKALTLDPEGVAFRI